MKDSVGHRIQAELQSRGADLVSFVDISLLPYEQNRGYQNAVLLGILLSPAYLLAVSGDPLYTGDGIKGNQRLLNGFSFTEKITDSLADDLADLLISMGYRAYSQSEKNLSATGFYNERNRSTPLPHKTVACLAGMGWIGRHSLLVTPAYGSAFSLCTVLTDAPLEVPSRQKDPMPGCGSCRLCVDICQTGAVKGKSWGPGINRDELLDVALRTSCLQCLVLCPWTRKYIRKEQGKTVSPDRPGQPGKEDPEPDDIRVFW